MLGQRGTQRLVETRLTEGFLLNVRANFSHPSLEAPDEAVVALMRPLMRPFRTVVPGAARAFLNSFLRLLNCDLPLPPSLSSTFLTQSNDLAMQSINRFLYGPTPEEKIRAWQAKLRAEQRQLDREMRQVGLCA